MSHRSTVSELTHSHGLGKWMQKPSKFGVDWCDRLNIIHTPALLLICTILSFYAEYVGKKHIQCWVPAQFTDSWEQYSESLCYAEGTYHVGFEEKQFPMNLTERRERYLIYYQWVPYIFFLQALTFVIGTAIWVITYRPSIKKVVKKLKKAVSAIAKKPSDAKFLRIRFTASYMAYKLYYVALCFAQLFVLNIFLGGSHDMFFGYRILSDLIAGRRWLESANFPRVTYCDVNVRVAGNKQNLHTFQCVLTLNMFNEKLFIAIWWWLAFSIAANLANLLQWGSFILYDGCLRMFVRTSLLSRIPDMTKMDPDAQIQAFADLMSADMRAMLLLMHFNMPGEDVIRRTYQCARDLMPVVTRERVDDDEEEASDNEQAPPDEDSIQGSVDGSSTSDNLAGPNVDYDQDTLNTQSTRLDYNSTVGSAPVDYYE